MFCDYGTREVINYTFGFYTNLHNRCRFDNLCNGCRLLKVRMLKCWLDNRPSNHVTETQIAHKSQHFNISTF